MKKKYRKALRTAVPVFTIFTVAAVAAPKMQVSAANLDANKSMPVYTVTAGDPYAMDTLKTQIITKLADENENLDITNIDIDKSSVDLQGYMPAKTGLQSVKAKVSLAMLGDSASSIAYTLSEDALVKVEKSSDPVLKLKSDTVTVTNSTDTGAVFDPATYIAAISDDSGVLPALKISSNVDTAADGNYFVSYTAVDNEGNSTNAVLNVTVKTPQEILDARAEAEAQAQKEAEDAEKKKQEEEQKQKEEALKKAQEEAEAAAAAQGDTSVAEKQYGTSGANPYPGGWSNCTYGAWEATYESTGVSLPNWGNAWNWLGNASASGYSTGRTPAAGSVAVYSHHVAYVDAVSADGTAVHIVEGGFNGHYNSRWVSPNGTGTQGLQGYIYIN